MTTHTQEAAEAYAQGLRDIGAHVEGFIPADDPAAAIREIRSILDGIVAGDAYDATMGAPPAPKVQIVAVLDGGLLTMAYVHGIALDDLDFITLDTDTDGASPEDGLHTVTLDGDEFETFVGGPMLAKLAEPFVCPEDGDAESAPQGMPEFSASATFADRDGERGSWDAVFKAATLEDARTTARQRLQLAHPYATKVDMTIRAADEPEPAAPADPVAYAVRVARTVSYVEDCRFLVYARSEAQAEALAQLKADEANACIFGGAPFAYERDEPDSGEWSAQPPELADEDDEMTIPTELVLGEAPDA